MCHARGIDELVVLVNRVAAGDNAAFADLYDRLAPSVYGVAKRVLRDRSHAEEVTQEVFVELWRNARRFDPAKASVRTWAATIAHRRSVDRVRSEQAHRNRHRFERLDTPGEDVDELTAGRELRRRATAALDQLSALQREALELAYFGGLTHVEVAEQLGIALGTAKTRIRDGVIKLRELLGEGVR